MQLSMFANKLRSRLLKSRSDCARFWQSVVADGFRWAIFRSGFGAGDFEWRFWLAKHHRHSDVVVALEEFRSNFAAQVAITAC